MGLRLVVSEIRSCRPGLAVDGAAARDVAAASADRGVVLAGALDLSACEVACVGVEPALEHVGGADDGSELALADRDLDSDRIQGNPSCSAARVT